jgi:hypothetical protein
MTYRQHQSHAGKARWAKQSPEARKVQARALANQRWAKYRETHKQKPQ